MKQRTFFGLAVALVTVGLGLGVSAHASSFDQQLTLDTNGEPILIKQGHKLYSIVLDPDQAETITVYRTNKTIDDAVDITDNPRWADFTADTVNITAQYGFHQYLYLATKNSAGDAELWRAPLNGRGAWQQVGANDFDSDVEKITSFAKRHTSKYQREVRNNGGVKNTLFASVSTADGNDLYRTTNGKDWSQVGVNDSFIDQSDNSLVGFAHHSADSTRYLYAVLEDGSVIRADATDMTTWEDVFTATVDPVDGDSTNPSLTVTDIARNGDTLYLIGSVTGDESQAGAVLASTDWASAERIYYTGNSSFDGSFYKPRLQGPLLMLANAADEWMNISRINTDNSVETLVLEEDGAGVTLRSLLRYRGTIYLGAYADETWIYTLNI